MIFERKKRIMIMLFHFIILYHILDIFDDFCCIVCTAHTNTHSYKIKRSHTLNYIFFLNLHCRVCVVWCCESICIYDSASALFDFSFIWEREKNAIEMNKSGRRKNSNQATTQSHNGSKHFTKYIAQSMATNEIPSTEIQQKKFENVAKLGQFDIIVLLTFYC